MMTTRIKNILSDPIRKWFFWGLIFHLIAAVFSDGFLQYDEHFEILEFLGFKLGKTPEADLSFEYGLKMRPWFQPFFYYYFSAPLRFLGLDNPFTLTLLFRVFSACLGFTSIILFYETAKERLEFDWQGKALAFLLNCLWFFPLIHARLSGEAIGGSLLVIAFSLWMKFGDKSNLRYFAIGLILGLSFLCRYHIGISIMFLWFWALIFKKTKISHLSLIAVGILLIIGAGTLIDYWGYGEWTFAPYEYLKFNVLQKGASKWGESPWWAYFKYIGKKGVYPITYPLLIAGIIFWFKKWKSDLTWITLPFFFAHSYIAHKELRFLFPLATFLPLMFVIALGWLKEPELFFKKSWVNILRKVFIGINLILLIQVSFRGLQGCIKFYKYTHSMEEKFEKVYVLGDLAPYRVAALNQHFFNFHYPEQILIPDNERKDRIQEMLDSDQQFWLFSTRGKFYFEMEKLAKCETTYMSIPRWTLGANIGNWIGRSEMWSLFNCNAK